MFSLRFRRNHLWPLGTDRLLRLGRGGGGVRRGVQFSKRLNFVGKFFENAQNVRGSKY